MVEMKFDITKIPEDELQAFAEGKHRTAVSVFIEARPKFKVNRLIGYV